MGFKRTKRELYYEAENGSGFIVEVIKGRDMYSKALRLGGIFKVDCQSPLLFDCDILMSSSCASEYFYINPEKSNIISRCDSYNDSWYYLNVGNIKNKTYKLVEDCLKVLLKNGFMDTSLVAFIKGDDGYYHLVVDGESYGYLDDSSSDIEFKNMLTGVFKDIHFSAEVVVLPSRGKHMFFSDTVAIYRTVDDFREACRSKRVLIASNENSSKGNTLISISNILNWA